MALPNGRHAVQVVVVPWSPILGTGQRAEKREKGLVVRDVECARCQDTPRKCDVQSNQIGAWSREGLEARCPADREGITECSIIPPR